MYASTLTHRTVQLSAHKNNPSKAYTRRLPRLAKQLEHAMYFESPSFLEYSDMATFQVRLDTLVQRLCNRGQQTTKYVKSKAQLLS